jgi:hypothetical protein
MKTMEKMEKMVTLETGLLKNNEIIKRTISFETLKKLSDFNFKRLNRNVDVDELLKEFPDIISKNVELESVMIHNHHKRKKTKPHVRCWVRIKEINFLGIQDIFLYQWEEMYNNNVIY